MKKVFLAAALLVTVASYAAPVTNVVMIVKASGDGRHIPESQVPAPVVANFDARYPTATNVKWEVEREHGQKQYKADFYIGGQRWEARFAADGTFISQKRK